MGLNWRTEKYMFLGGLALLCVVLLFVGGPGPYSSRTFTYAWGLGHLFCFALWTYLYLAWRSPQPWLRQVGEVIFLALLVGACSELLQAGFGREATWQDLGNDLLGSLLSLAFAPAIKRQLPALRILLFRFLVLALVGWAIIPFAKVAIDDLVARQQFPLLSGFETPLELSRWGGASKRQLDRQYVYSGSTTLRVDFSTSRYSGVALKYFPADWSSYQELRFQIYNPEKDPLQLYFRIHDQKHKLSDNRYSDRYNTSFVAATGWSEIKILLSEVTQAPRDRRMDLSKTAGMILFVDKLDRSRTIYLDDVALHH